MPNRIIICCYYRTYNVLNIIAVWLKVGHYVLNFQMKSKTITENNHKIQNV